MPIASWRRRGAVYVPLQEGWEDLLDELERRVPDAIFSLTISKRDGTIHVSGAVRSELAYGILFELVDHKIGDMGLSFEVEVTGVFQSASRDDPFDAMFSEALEDLSAALVVEEARGLREVELLLYPSISTEDEGVPGVRMRITVDLQYNVDDETDGDAVILRDLPDDWTEFPVSVELQSGELDFDTQERTIGRGMIHVRRGRRSLPAIFDAVVSRTATRDTGIMVTAIFVFRGRHAGVAKRTFPLAATGTAGTIQSNPESDSSNMVPRGAAAVSLVPEARAPELTVHILSDHRVDGGLNWSFTAPNAMGMGPRERNGRIDLAVTAKTYAYRILANCPRTPPEQAGRVLRGIGEQIWAAAPVEFRDLYLAMREKFGSQFPIQIVTDEPYVPWEIMRPNLQDDRDDHLYLTHPLSRWTVADAGRMRNEFVGSAIESFVPDYGSDKSLPEALEEGRWLVDRFAATAHQATYERFMGVLECDVETSEVLLVHFAGHGSRLGGEDEPPSLQLLDKKVSLTEIGQSGVRLGRRDGSFFILNACAMGRMGPQLGAAEGWASALLANGFGGVLAPLWEVQDETASRTVRSFIEAFVGRNATLGAAMLAARREHRASSATPFAYICHGDVMAKTRGRHSVATAMR